MTTTEPDYRDLLPVIIDREHAVLPDGCDRWGIKSVHPDLKTYGGYQWPYPGNWAECDPAAIDYDNTGSCPNRPGDGLCVATTWRAMASGGIPAITMLLVAWSSASQLGADLPDKLRAARVHVVAVVDGARLLREAGQIANLRDANLRGANLRDANLRDANLRDANLRGANLGGANLGGANLGGANLGGANLGGADLWDANLRGADLWGADLGGANLWGANLGGANLTGWVIDPATGITARA